MDNKTCVFCNETKPTSEFYRRGTSFRHGCKQCDSEKSKLCYQKNREQILNRNKQYYLDNRQNKLEYMSKRKEITAARKRKRLREDVQFRLAHNLRARLSQAVRKDYRGSSAVQGLGTSLEELKLHLEKHFQSGMSWDNYGRRGWHIDHIIPLINFDLTNKEECQKACHFTNLQPLWEEDNLRKGANL